MVRRDYRIVFAWGLTPLRRSIHVTSVLAHRFCMGWTPLRRNMMIKIDGTLILASRAWLSGAMVIFSGFVHNLISGGLHTWCRFVAFCVVTTLCVFAWCKRLYAGTWWWIAWVQLTLDSRDFWFTNLITKLSLMVKIIFIQTFRTNWCDLAPFVCVTIYRLMLLR